ncbi:cupin domain-containing protein [soil metagenome]
MLTNRRPAGTKGRIDSGTLKRFTETPEIPAEPHSPRAAMPFHDFDTALFLRDYWQKKPLLIRNPWTSWSNPLDPDELAGLACEDDVEARMVMQTGGKARPTWKVEHGPFEETRFDTLGKKPWTLLVQAVDIQVPDVAALIDPFRFVPNWRIDDVMVSYATDGGGVGPHFDQYDVFLIQGLGQRRWQVGASCDGASALLPHDDLRLLAHFEATDEWILEPGDILYVPPRVAHNGIAVGGDCMTYSVGFRAPSRSELIAHYCDEVLDRLQDDDRYEDPSLQTAHNPGEITETAIARLHAMITETMQDRDAFARWFGQYNSTPKYPDLDWRPDAPITVAGLRRILNDKVPLCRNPASRFSFIRQSERMVLLFVDGQCFACVDETASFAERICAQDHIVIDPGMAQSDVAMDLMATLFNQGSIAFDQED